MPFPAIIAALAKLVGGAVVAKGGAAAVAGKAAAGAAAKTAVATGAKTAVSKGFLGTVAKHASTNWMGSTTAELGKAPVAKVASPATYEAIAAGGKEQGMEKLKGLMDKMFKDDGAGEGSGPGGVDAVSLTPVNMPASRGGTSNAVDRPYVPMRDLF